IRPNQLYAISLPYPLLTGKKAESVLRIVTEKLLTPKGLRTLAPGSAAYKSQCVGDVWMRDSSYHQGTVWSFLIGAYVYALFYVNDEHALEKSKDIISTFVQHLDEAGVGTVSEIFDGDAPHAPRGCIAQAWGVAEVLRVIVQYRLMP